MQKNIKALVDRFKTIKPSQFAKFSSQPSGNDPQSKPGAISNDVLKTAETRLSGQIIMVSFIANLLGLAMPLAIFQIYDRILPNQSSATLFWLIVGLLAAVCIDTLLRTLRSYLLGWDALKNGHKAQQLALRKLLYSKANISKLTPTKWLDGFDALSEFSAFQGGQNRTILIDIPMAFIFLSVVGLVGGILILVPIVLIIAFGLFSYIQGNEIQLFLDKRSQQDNRQNEFLLESFSNIQTVKSLAVESQLLRRFELLQKSSTMSSFNAIISTNKLQTQGVMFSNMMMICVVSFGAVHVVSGDMSLAALACCSLLTGRMVQPFAKALTLFHELQNIRLARARCEVFSLEHTDQYGVDENKQRLKSGTFSVRDAVIGDQENIKYQHPISILAEAGTFIGIHCQETPERTELVKMFSGERMPKQGAVFADGFSSKQWHELGLQREIGFVSRRSEIFQGSIIDNITMFGGGNMLDEARYASKIIGLEQDVFRLPDGYDTMLGVGSASVLSPGLLQRIKIARTLMRRPKILIFDGANSSLDMRSDKLLTDGLLQLKGQMTGVFFSSRPSFLKIADQRLVLKSGQLLPDDFALKGQKAHQNQVVESKSA